MLGLASHLESRAQGVAKHSAGAGDETAGLPLDEQLLNPNGPVHFDTERLARVLQQKGLALDELKAVLALRRRLFDLDTRFAQLGPQGLFAALDQAGVLDHAVPGVDNIEHAIANPPAIGRARLRGECVRRFHARAADYCCDWTGVWDVRNRRHLDLSEPFAAEAKWSDSPTPDIPWEMRIRSPLRESAVRFAFVCESLARARTLYDQGRCDEAHWKLEQVRPLRESFNADNRQSFLRLSAWVQTRRGFLDGPAILAELAPHEGPLPLWLITDYAFAFRFCGLAPSAELAVWLRKGEDRLRQEPAETLDTVAAFREHQGYALLSAGQLRKAAKVLKQACHLLRRSGDNARVVCRASVTLAEACRRMGAVARAQALLDEAMAAQTEHHFRGDLADLSLACLAKLQTDPARARSILADCKNIQVELVSRVGEARTLLLEARFAADAEQAAARAAAGDRTATTSPRAQPVPAGPKDPSEMAAMGRRRSHPR